MVITEMEREDIPFLQDLWRDPEVMRYADEFPRMRHWSKDTEPEEAWVVYQECRSEQGPPHSQLILRLPDGLRIGESFFAPLPEGFAFGYWRKPPGIVTLMGDLKLLPAFWRKGLGTAGMRQVVRWAFQRTDCDLFVVPPHVHGNPAAVEVYEKAGFVLKYKRSGAGHRIMELWRTRFEELY